MWHRLHNIKRETGGKIVAEIDFPPESKWFLGHFPGDPLLPAVAQLAVVREVLSSVEARPYALTELKRIKFKAMVRPGDSLSLEVTPKTGSPDRHSFRLFRGSDIVGSGMVGCNPAAMASE